MRPMNVGDIAWSAVPVLMAGLSTIACMAHAIMTWPSSAFDALSLAALGLVLAVMTVGSWPDFADQIHRERERRALNRGESVCPRCGK